MHSWLETIREEFKTGQFPQAFEHMTAAQAVALVHMLCRVMLPNKFGFGGHTQHQALLKLAKVKVDKEAFTEDQDSAARQLVKEVIFAMWLVMREFSPQSNLRKALSELVNYVHGMQDYSVIEAAHSHLFYPEHHYHQILAPNGEPMSLSHLLNTPKTTAAGTKALLFACGERGDAGFINVAAQHAALQTKEPGMAIWTNRDGSNIYFLDSLPFVVDWSNFSDLKTIAENYLQIAHKKNGEPVTQYYGLLAERLKQSSTPAELRDFFESLYHATQSDSKQADPHFVFLKQVLRPFIYYLRGFNKIQVARVFCERHDGQDIKYVTRKAAELTHQIGNRVVRVLQHASEARSVDDNLTRMQPLALQLHHEVGAGSSVADDRTSISLSLSEESIEFSSSDDVGFSLRLRLAYRVLTESSQSVIIAIEQIQTRIPGAAESDRQLQYIRAAAIVGVKSYLDLNLGVTHHSIARMLQKKCLGQAKIVSGLANPRDKSTNRVLEAYTNITDDSKVLVLATIYYLLNSRNSVDFANLLLPAALLAIGVKFVDINKYINGTRTNGFSEAVLKPLDHDLAKKLAEQSALISGYAELDSTATKSAGLTLKRGLSMLAGSRKGDIQEKVNAIAEMIEFHR